jgi:plasmid stability protein
MNSMNLELDADLMAALQAEAARSGRSQQEIVHEAITHHLSGNGAPGSDRARARAEGLVQPARIPYRKVEPRLLPPNGTTSLDLLNRDDRF